MPSRPNWAIAPSMFGNRFSCSLVTPAAPGGTHAVAAATALSGTGHREIEQESYHVRMLAAVRTAFQATGATELATRDLILRLLLGEAESCCILVVVSHDPDVLERSDDVIELGR